MRKRRKTNDWKKVTALADMKIFHKKCFTFDDDVIVMLHFQCRSDKLRWSPCSSCSYSSLLLFTPNLYKWPKKKKSNNWNNCHTLCMLNDVRIISLSKWKQQRKKCQKETPEMSAKGELRCLKKLFHLSRWKLIAKKKERNKYQIHFTIWCTKREKRAYLHIFIDLSVCWREQRLPLHTR